MSKPYLVIERGLAGGLVFHLQTRLTIGRAPESDIHLPDPSVSRHHALAYLEDEKAILEDMGSRNGTYVNEERIKKAVLSSDDAVRVGNIIVRYLKEEGRHGQAGMKETRGLNRRTRLGALKNHTSLQRSKKLAESVSNTLLFYSLDREDLEEVCKSASLLVCNPGRTIIRHGEWCDSLYVILDGRMRVFTYDHQGTEITLQLLGENHFFGESPLLTGSPHMTSVEALEQTLLCKLSFETIRDLAERHPIITDLLEQNHRDRLNHIERRRESLGLKRRKHPRYEIRLTVSLSVSPVLSLSDQFQDRIFRGNSTNISLSGIRVRFKETSLRLLPMGCNVRLEIFLPPPLKSIRCIGIVRHIMETDEDDDRTRIGIEFLDISSATQKILENFLYRWVAAEA